MTTQTLTLAHFLLARIAEDEALGRAEGAGWRGTAPGLPLQDARDTYCEGFVLASPNRVLAECEVKRRIVEWCTIGYAAHQRNAADVLRLLALPYADHPDYVETWRP